MNNGWIKLHKKIRKHWIWEHPEFLLAWIDMLMMANWTDHKKLYKMELHKIKRGEFPASIRKLSLRWDWSTGKVQRFLNLLKTDKMIDTLTDTGYTLVKIVNYEQYQVVDRHTDKHTDRHTNDTLTDTTIRSKKNIKEYTGETKVPLLSYFGNAFKEFIGVEYHASFGKDGKLLKSLEKHYGYGEVITGIDYFFSVYIQGDKFSKKNPNVGMLHNVWNGMIAKSKESKQKTDDIKEWVNG